MTSTRRPEGDVDGALGVGLGGPHPHHPRVDVASHSVSHRVTFGKAAPSSNWEELLPRKEE